MDERTEHPNVFVAVDIGCVECGEESAVLGIFDDKADAQRACDEAQKKMKIQSANWTGHHSFQIFEVPARSSRPLGTGDSTNG